MIRLPRWVRQSRVRGAGVSLVPEDLEFKGLKALADIGFDVMKREDRGTQPRRDEVEGVGLEDKRPEQLADRPGRREVPEREDRGRHAQPVVGRPAAQHLEASHELRTLHAADRTAVGGMSELDALAREHGIDPEAPDALVKARALMCDLRDLVGVLTVSADAASLSAAGVGFPLARAAIAEGRRQRAASGLFDGPTQDQVVLYVDDPSEELVGVVVGVARSTHESSPSVGRSRVAARSVVGAPGAVAPGAGVPTVEDPADTLLSSPSVGGSAGPVGGDGLGLSSPTGDLGAGAGS